ncbi:helicase-associated domain-containing protein [Skeletonema marinoi]|uniref:Helicase-associated domain-containing protein n=1 Tax=Skeletonema marinoi TaxID=267567 RepID=A0AAD9D5X5_9STRA|nr:helicase-associated domain-containing protein [Skeletonema marinoi]
MNERDNQAFNPLPPLRGVDAGYQFDTSPNGAESPYLSFLGTTPPQASDSYSPDSPEAVKYASASAEKWRDTSEACKESPMNRNNALDLSEDAIMNTSHLFDEAAGLDLDDVDDLTSLSCPPLSSFKTEETSAEDSPQAKANGQPPRDSDSPDAKSTSSGSSNDTWQTRLEELKEYKEKHGDVEVPQKYGPLGTWVNKQRNEYNKIQKGVKSQLTQERISQLNSINFRWAQSKGQKLWETRFNELKEYKEKNCHCNVNTKDGRLGRWVTTQRSDHKNNKISKGNKAKLDSIGFQWKMLGLDK